METQPPRIISIRAWVAIAAGTALLTYASVRWLGSMLVWDAIVIVLLAELFLASCAVVLCIITERLSASYLTREVWWEQQLQSLAVAEALDTLSPSQRRQQQQREDSARIEQQIRHFLHRSGRRLRDRPALSLHCVQRPRRSPCIAPRRPSPKSIDSQPLNRARFPSAALRERTDAGYGPVRMARWR